MLQGAKENFDKLESRIIAINSNYENAEKMRELLYSLDVSGKPSLIMATGGSKVVAYYLQIILERSGYFGFISDVIEPRDYFYKYNTEKYDNLVVISASGNTNGVKEALKDFKKNKFLVCENNDSQDYEVVSWGNDEYDKEKSFISMASSLGPMALLLDSTSPYGGHRLELCKSEIKEVNKRISDLLKRCRDKISNLPVSFKDEQVVHIMSGYDTKCSCCTLESTLVEAGLCNPIVHDKGSFCHGRSNLINRDTPIIYLSHEKDDLDKLLLDELSKECDKVYNFNTEDIRDLDYFYREYYLVLQMYYLCKKIAEDKNKDLTKPDYNPRLIKSLYNYRGML